MIAKSVYLAYKGIEKNVLDLLAISLFLHYPGGSEEKVNKYGDASSTKDLSLR